MSVGFESRRDPPHFSLPMRAALVPWMALGGRTLGVALTRKFRDKLAAVCFGAGVLLTAVCVFFVLIPSLAWVLFYYFCEVWGFTFGIDAPLREWVTVRCFFVDSSNRLLALFYFPGVEGVCRCVMLHLFLSYIDEGTGVDPFTFWLVRTGVQVYLSVSATSIDPFYFEGVGVIACSLTYTVGVWVLLLVIRGGAPRYRIEQLAQYAFVGLLPAVAGLVVLVGIVLIIL